MHNSAISHEIVSGYLTRSVQRVATWTRRLARAHTVISYFHPVHLSALALFELLSALRRGCNRRPASTPLRCSHCTSNGRFSSNPLLRVAFRQLLNIILVSFVDIAIVIHRFPIRYYHVNLAAIKRS